MNNDYQLYDRLQKFTSLPKEQLDSIINLAPNSYKIFYIDKKYNNKKRRICQPSKETKMLQYYLLDNFFSNFAIHPAAMAYVKGLQSPLKTNALTHSNFQYSVHLDFENFFPSIVPEDLMNVIGNKFTKEDIKIIKKVCFILVKSRLNLTIGAPVSPIISNIVMYNLDELLTKKSQEIGGVYTRYADDILFSSNNDKDCEVFKKYLVELIKETSSPKLKINEKKTYFYHKNEPRRITGLIVSSYGEVKTPRSQKRVLRSLIHKSTTISLSSSETNILKGHMAFIKDNEPEYINTLFMKYGKALKKFYYNE